MSSFHEGPVTPYNAAIARQIQSPPLAGTTLVAGLLLSSPRLEGITVTPEELTERRDWVAARFEGRQPP
jgi:hypothetical protein